MINRNLQSDLFFGIRVTATLLLMILCALIMLVIAVLTFFRARRVYHQYLATPCAQLLLALWGIRLEIQKPEPFPSTQTIYISNHTSTLDMFILLALGLPNTRFFLSGYLRKLLPLGLIGYLTGIFWTVDQKFPETRIKIFKRAESTLRQTGESVYLSPEGERITNGEIGHFNKGAFHLATNLKVPIVPLYIATPRDIDPGLSLRVKPGTVCVYVKPKIFTADWRLNQLTQNKEMVRKLFILWNRQHKS